MTGVERVNKDAARIAAQLRQGRTTVKGLMVKYHCGHATIIAAILSQISPSEWKRLKHDRQLSSNAATRFKPGHEPWNKNSKGIHLSPISEFKKDGPLRGFAARRWRPIGTITIRHDQPLRSQRRHPGPKVKGKPRRWIKVKDDGPLSRRWIPYARYLWERRNGPVPAGYIVVHEDGNQMHDVIGNLIIVNRRRHLHRTSHSDPNVAAKAHAAACESRKRNTQARRKIRRLEGPQRQRWYCPACGATYEQHPARCPKCTACELEKIKIPQATAATSGQTICKVS